jgi:hypothetical protein
MKSTGYKQRQINLATELANSIIFMVYAMNGAGEGRVKARGGLDFGKWEARCAKCAEMCRKTGVCAQLGHERGERG